MRIQHNISALNAHRQFGNNNTAVSGNLEKLSSGYRINKAGDDAAGLAISEKMRAQIKGLDTAQKNAQDGISLVQTAEGALTEVHSMLNRMVELATQSANGTYDDDTDRKNLQKEVESLQTEIDRIADSTNYNGIELLNGALSSGSTTVTGDKVPFKLSDAQTSGLVTNQPTAAKTTFNALAANLTVANTKELEISFNYTDNAGVSKTVDLKFTVDSAKKKLITDDGTEYSLASGSAVTAKEFSDAVVGELNKNDDIKANFKTITADNTGKIEATALDKGSKGAAVDTLSYHYDKATVANLKTLVQVDTVNSAAGTDKSYGIQLDTTGTDGKKAIGYTGVAGENLNDFVFEVDGKKFVFATAAGITEMQKNGNKDINYLEVAAATLIDAEGTKMATLIGQKTGLSGVTYDTTNDVINFAANTKTTGAGLTLQIGDTSDEFNQVAVSIDDMHAEALGIGNINVGDQAKAKEAIKTIKEAINSVSSTRGDLGALQNRLDHTINNLGVASENMSAAESRIRDVDMAKEMMDFTKNNILTQASQAMLAQANQLPQGVLQLLQ